MIRTLLIHTQQNHSTVFLQLLINKVGTTCSGFHSKPTTRRPHELFSSVENAARFFTSFRSRTPFSTVSHFVQNVLISMREEEWREIYDIHLSFLVLEPRGERQRAAPFCAACGLLDHAQRIPMERILQGGS